MSGDLDRARLHFHALDREQQAQAIRRLAAAGQGDHAIARATSLGVELVRRVLANQNRRDHQQ